jgi:hypothetical protein
MKIKLHQWLRRYSLLPIQGDMYLDVIFTIIIVLISLIILI